MIAPCDATRARAEGRAPGDGERASNSRAHEAHLAPEEHASDAPPAESRGLGANDEAQCSSTASSQPRRRAHAETADAPVSAQPDAVAAEDRVERTAAKREKRRFVVEPLREVAELRGLIGGPEASANGRFPWLVSLLVLLVPAPAHAPGRREAGTCLQPAAGGGGGSAFRTAAHARRSAWGRFRVGQFQETEQPGNYESSAHDRTEHGGPFGSIVRVRAELSTGPQRARRGQRSAREAVRQQMSPWTERSSSSSEGCV